MLIEVLPHWIIGFNVIGILVIAVFIFLWGVYYSFTDAVFRIIPLTGSLSYTGIISGHAGLFSFVLAPIGLVLGSKYS